LYFQNLEEISFDYQETVDVRQGKIETRKYWTMSDIEWLQSKKELEESENN
jgi:hypothetical protein